MAHTSVLLNESINGLGVKSGDIFVDATLGDGGHTLEIIKNFGEEITVVGIDRDQSMIDRVSTKIKNISSKVILRQGDFRNIDSILKEAKIDHADKFLFDLGLNSRQIEESGRGFSFKNNEPLVMTFESDQSDRVTAKDVVNEWEEETLAGIIKGFGEERFAARIAHAIVAARKIKTIETTNELTEIILSATPNSYHHGRIHPATRTFQAIRIAVNDELNAIQSGLKAAWKMLRPKGRIAVISFHSLEDRIVKKFFNELKVARLATVITKKPIIADRSEVQSNPRSRSAKLRILEKN